MDICRLVLGKIIGGARSSLLFATILVTISLFFFSNVFYSRYCIFNKYLIMLTTNVLSTLDISNIGNYPVVFKNIVWVYYLFSNQLFLSQTSDVSE